MILTMEQFFLFYYEISSLLDKVLEKFSVELTLRTSGLISSATEVISFMATSWSMLLACSVRSVTEFINVPSAYTAAARTYNKTHICMYTFNWRQYFYLFIMVLCLFAI